MTQPSDSANHKSSSLSEETDGARARPRAAKAKKSPSVAGSSAAAPGLTDFLTDMTAKAHELEEKAAAADRRHRELDQRDAELTAKAHEAEEKIAAADRRHRELDERDVELRHKADELQTRGTAIKAQDEELARRRLELDERDQQLLQKEIEHTAASERAKAEARAEARESLKSIREEIDAERTALDQIRDRQRKELQEDRDELEKEKSELRKLRAALTAKEEDLNELKELYDEREAQAIAAATEQLQHRYNQLDQMHQAARKEADELEEQRRERERLDRALGDSDDTRAELQALREENEQLRKRRIMPEGTMERLATLQQEQQHWEDDRAVLVAENERLQRQLSGYEVTAVELERLKITKEAAEGTVQLYRATVEEMRRDIDGLTERRDGVSVFPECSRMDQDHDEPPEDLAQLDELPSLPDLITRVRHLIRSRHSLYYSERQLRCFLAGLATSRLHLLQGISGIGKTELPQRFAEALGATSAVVSVGADWRTPQDLMGYYNAFERRFYESEFTQALYQAMCPEFNQQPFFIVLDEMNLSHPEQYFNDVLSALELRKRRDGSPPDLVLMSAGVEPAPKLLRDNRKLPLPPNVWFIGTANHDETTVTFADKTYDRAHVLELPARYEAFPSEPTEPLSAISLEALNRAFNKARRSHSKSAGQVRDFLDNELADTVMRDFRISWGGRLWKHLRNFVPVVIASGGTVTEAADHIVATKILRKLSGRLEVEVPKLVGFQQQLESIWSQLGDNADSEGPTASRQLLDHEIYLRGGR